MAAHYASWDRFTLDPSRFVSTYRHAEHRLLGQLTAYREQVPPVELVSRNAYAAWEGPQALWFGLSGSLLVVGAAMCRLETARFRNTWTCHWHPALVRSLALLLSLPAATAVSGMTVHFSTRLHQVPVRHYTLALDIDQTVRRLESWAGEQDYELRLAGSWAFETIPARQPAAQVLWFEGRPRGIFNRWRMTWHGPQRPRPILKIQCLSGGTPPETIVRIDAGVVPDGSTERATWRPVLDSLQESCQEPGKVD